LSDYSDSIKRAERLSIARESLLLNGSCASIYTLIEKEDLEIYLRWLICHFYSQRTFQQAIKTIEWLPIQMSTEHFCNYKASQAKSNNMPSYLSTSQDTNNDGNNNNNNNNNNNIESIYRLSNESSSNNYSTNNSNSIASVLINKYKLLDSIYLPFVNPLVPRDDILNSISYCIFNYIFTYMVY